MSADFAASAFPMPKLFASPGLTKEEYFAGQALIGLIATGKYGDEAAANKAKEYGKLMVQPPG